MYISEITFINSSIFIKEKIKPFLLEILDSKNKEKIKEVLNIVKIAKTEENKFKNTVNTNKKKLISGIDEYLKNMPNHKEIIKMLENEGNNGEEEYENFLQNNIR